MLVQMLSPEVPRPFCYHQQQIITNWFGFWFKSNENKKRNVSDNKKLYKSDRFLFEIMKGFGFISAWMLCKTNELATWRISPFKQNHIRDMWKRETKLKLEIQSKSKQDSTNTLKRTTLAYTHSYICIIIIGHFPPLRSNHVW